VEPQLRLTLPTLTSAHLAAIGKSPAGLRAIALLQVGEAEMAAAELRQIAPRDNRLLREALMVLSDRAGLAETTMRLGNLVAAPDGAAYDAALYPMPSWQPRGGFQLVRARFDDITDISRDVLLDPARNLDIGQRYLGELMTMPAVGDNLFYLAAAFNAGPGNLVKWRRQFRDIKDPLLFIESVPFAETRDYFEKVLANYWIYRMRLGQDTASLDQVAAGQWPTYTPVEGRPVLQAATLQSVSFDDNAEN